jgi:hypothetical protein
MLWQVWEHGVSLMHWSLETTVMQL